MGTFGGHVLPGSFFLIFSFWWIIQIYRRYYRSLRHNSGVCHQNGGTVGRDDSLIKAVALPYRSTATFSVVIPLPTNCNCCRRCTSRGSPTTCEVEGIAKVFFTLVGLIIEIITGFHDGRFAYFGNAQHATMFFFFCMSGIVDIIVHRSPNLLPKGVEYLTGALAFAVEDVLFMFHTHGRLPMDVLLHTLLVYVISLCVIVSLLELRYRHSVLISLARAYSVLLQGLWFWQVAFILYNPNPAAVKWNQEDHEQMMIVTMIFAWHMAIAFVIVVAMGPIVKFAENRCASSCCRTGCAKDGSRSLCGGTGDVQYDQIKLVDQDDEHKNNHVDFNGEELESSEDEAMFERAEVIIARQK